MQHVFAFDEETRRYKEEDGAFFSPEAELALHHGILYYKIDGSNGMVQVIAPKNAGDGDKEVRFKAYQRLDKKGKDPDDTLISLPAGKNPMSYPGHSYYYSEITTDVPGKKQVKRNRAMLDLVTRNADKFIGMEREWISVEWVGSMFNKTPSVPHAIALAIHEDQFVEGRHSGDNQNIAPAAEQIEVQDGGETTLNMEVEHDSEDNEKHSSHVVPIIKRSYRGMRKFLLEDCVDHPIEGLILAYEGVYWKIRCDSFELPKGAKDPFRTNRENAMVPVYLV